MQTRVLRVLCAVIMACSAATAAQQDVHLFILSGQSNMAGLNPDLSFTPALAAVFGKTNLVVVKDAESGQPIRRWCKTWKPAQGDAPQPTGDLYDRLMNKVNAAIKDKTVSTVTVVWMQGETDAIEAHGEVYAASLQGLRQQLQGDLQRSDINWVIGRISDWGIATYPHWTLVRQAQVTVAESDPLTAWVDTDDLNGPQNALHYTADGYEQLGTRFAETAIALVNEHPPAIKSGKARAGDVR